MYQGKQETSKPSVYNNDDLHPLCLSITMKKQKGLIVREFIIEENEMNHPDNHDILSISAFNSM